MKLQVHIIVILWLINIVVAIAASSPNKGQANITGPTTQLKAAIFPFEVQHGIDLYYDDSNDGPFDLPTLKVQVRHGSLVPTNPFPGLYVNNKENGKVIEATGPVEDLQLWLESSSTFHDNSGMYHGQVFPGGGIRYMPPHYDWIGADEVQLHLIEPEKNEIDDPRVLATSKVALHVDPNLEIAVRIAASCSNDTTTIQINEDESFRPFQKHSSGQGGVTVDIGGVARTKVITCSFMVSSGSFSPKRVYGTIGKINETMAMVEYSPDINFNGKVDVTVGCYNGHDNQYDEGEFEIYIKPVNDRPQIMIRPDRVFETKEDQSLNLGATANIFVVDVDARESRTSRIAVCLNVTKGNLLLHLPPSEYLGGVYVASDSMTDLLFFGHIDDVNIALQYITVSFGMNWYGRGSISVKCTDVYEFTSKPMEILYYDWILDQIDYVIESVNDAPNITIMESELEIWEGNETYSFDKFMLINDVDSNSSDQLNVTIELIEVNKFMPGYFVSKDDNHSISNEKSRSIVSIQATLLTLPFHLKSIRVVFWEDWYGYCYQCISVHATDAIGGEATAKISLKVHPINDAPTLTMSRNSISTNEDEQVVLSSAVNLTIHDADELYSTTPVLFTFKIKSFKGGLIGFKRYIPGCHIVEGDPYTGPTSTLILKASTSILNTALKTLYYEPPSNFESVDSLFLEVSDEHQSKCNVKLDVQVVGINDPPKIEFHNIEKKQDSNGKPYFKTGLEVSDPDRNEFLTLSITLQPSAQGSVSCPQLHNSGVSIASKLQDRVSFSGDLASVRSAVIGIVVSLDKATTDNAFTLTATIVDKGGQRYQLEQQIQSEMNARVPKLNRYNGTVKVLEDVPVNMVTLVNFDDVEEFKDSLIFELKFTCPSDEMYRDRGVAFAAPYFKFLDLFLPGIHIPRYDIESGSLGTISFRGNVIALKTALQKLQFLPPLNFSGRLSISCGVRAVKKSTYSDIFTTEKIELEIKPVDDPPVILWKRDMFLDNDPFVDLDEDTFQKFGSMISVQDDDIYNGILSFDIKATHGSLCSSWRGHDLFHNYDSAFFETNENKEYICVGQNLSLQSSIVFVNGLIETLAYKPDANWWGMDKLIIQVQSNDAVVTKSIRLAVRPKSDETIIHLADDKFEVREDNSLLFQDAISLSDNDFTSTLSPEYDYCVSHIWMCYIALTLRVSEGSLVARGIGSALVIQQHTEENELTMKGLITDLNQSLKTLVYTPKRNYFGQDSLQITVKPPAQEEQSSRNVSLTIIGENDLPKLSLPMMQNNSSFFVYEDMVGIIGDDHCQDYDKLSPFITCQKIVISDMDQEHNNTYKLNLYTQNGYLKIPRLRLMSNISVKAEFVTDDYANDIYLVGTLGALNYAVVGIYFKGKPNYNSKNTYEEIFISLEEEGNGVVNDSIKIKVIPVNDSPVIQVEGEISDDNILLGDGIAYQRLYIPTLVMEEDSSILMDVISVRDIDCSNQSELLEMTLHVSNGLLLLRETQIRQWLVGDLDKFYRQIQFRDTIDNINEALQYLVYKPNPNFHGEDFLYVHVSDMGNSGFVRGEKNDFSIQSPLFDAANISLSIQPVEDAPLIEAPTFLQLDEDSTAALAIKLLYFDSVQNKLQLFVKCSNGKIDLKYKRGLRFIDGSSNDSTQMAVEGTVLDLKRALSQVVFTPPNNWNTKDIDLDKIEISIRNPAGNLGNITHVVFVSIQNINDPPDWKMPNSLVENSGEDNFQPIEIFEDHELNLGSMSVTDVDANNNDSRSLYTVRISAMNGNLNIGKYSKLLSSTSNQKNLEFSSTFYFVNEALSCLVYKPLPDYYGEDNIKFFVMDSEYNSSISIPIQVIAVTDVPVIEAPSVVVCQEEEWCKLQNIWIKDKDLNDKLILEISVRDGLVAFAGGLVDPLRSISVLEGSRRGDDYYQLNGTASDLNKTTQQLAYLPNLGDAATMTVLTLSIKVPETAIEQQQLHYTKQIFVAITDSENNHPVIRYNKALYHDDPKCLSSFRSNSLTSISKLHAFCDESSSLEPFQCVEDIPCALYGLTVDDPDSSFLTLSLSVKHGELILSIQQGIFVELVDNKNTMNIQGNVTNINNSLETLKYIPKGNFVGKDFITLKLEDPTVRNTSTYSYEMTIEIIVHNVEDRIKISGPDYIFHSQDEDTISLIPGLSLVHEHNVPSERLIMVEVLMEVMGGNINLHGAEGLNFTIPSPAEESYRIWNHNTSNYVPHIGGAIIGATVDDTNDISSMGPYWWRNTSFCGLLENVNYALENIAFAGNQDMNTDTDGLAEINVFVKQVNQCFGENKVEANEDKYDGNASVVIYVKPVNDAPIVVSGQITQGRFQNIEQVDVDEDKNMSIPTNVQDVDNNILTVEIDVSESGQVSVSKNPNQSNDIYFIEGTPNNFQSHLILKGTIESLNAFLINMIFRGKKNYFGNESVVTVKACDDHDSCHSRNIRVHVNSIDDAIQLYIPVDETLSTPRIVLDEGDNTLIGSTWIQEENLLMKRVIESTNSEEENPTQDYQDIDPYDLQPLNIQTAFMLKDGNEGTATMGREYNNREVCIQLTVDKGMISLKDGSYIHGLKDGEQTKRIETNGSINDINEYLARNIMYNSINGETGYVQLQILVSRDTDCNEEDNETNECKCKFDVHDASASLNIFVVSVNSAPVIEWIAGEEFPGAKINMKTALKGIYIKDEDMGDPNISYSHQRIHGGFVTVTLSVTKGELSFGSLAGLTLIEGDGSYERVIRITGNLDNVNKSLLTLEYRCMDIKSLEFEENGSCQPNDVIELKVHVDDNGFAGKGGAKQDTYVMKIQIKSE